MNTARTASANKGQHVSSQRPLVPDNRIHRPSPRPTLERHLVRQTSVLPINVSNKKYESCERPTVTPPVSTPSANLSVRGGNNERTASRPSPAVGRERTTRRTSLRSENDLQLFIDMDLNTIGQESSDGTDQRSTVGRSQRRGTETNRVAMKPVRISAKTSSTPTVHMTDTTFTQHDLKLLLPGSTRLHRSTGSNGTTTINRPSLRLLPGSSSEASGAEEEVGDGNAHRSLTLRLLNLDSVNPKIALISPLGSSVASDLVSLGSASQATSAVSVPAASDSYINRNNYVTKPRWDLMSQDMATDDDSDVTRSITVQQPTLSPQPPPSQVLERRLTEPNLAAVSRPSSAQRSQLGDDLFTFSGRRKSSGRTNPLGAKMDVLSMEKVFNDPSFHGIYEQYAKNRGRASMPSSEACTLPIASVGRTDESPFVRAVREQIPNQVAILDTEVLSLLTDSVLKQNPLLRRLQQASFRRRGDGTIECLSVMDLGLEKKDHQFLTETWLNLARLTDGCREIYDVIDASGCRGTAFVRNIMAFMSHAIDQGLELAAVLIKTATFVVVRDGQAKDLLDYVQQVRQLTESLHSHTDFLDTVRDVLTENFSAIPLVAGDAGRHPLGAAATGGKANAKNVKSSTSDKAATNVTDKIDSRTSNTIIRRKS